MPFSHLTIQSLQAARQRVAYSGLAGLGTTKAQTNEGRPSVDYVKAGDVIRINVVWLRASSWFVFDVTPIYAAFRNGLARSFNVLAMSPVENWTPGGTIAVDLQPRSDYGKLNDVVAVVAHEAQAAGLSVDVGRTYGEFVSKVEGTGGTPPPTIRDPTQANNASNTINDFLNSLTKSPTTLAVILGAAVILVIAAKR